MGSSNQGCAAIERLGGKVALITTVPVPVDQSAD